MQDRKLPVALGFLLACLVSMAMSTAHACSSMKVTGVYLSRLANWMADLRARAQPRSFVPSAPRIWRRIGYLAAFLLGIYLLGAGALWVTFWVMLAIHGA